MACRGGASTPLDTEAIIAALAASGGGRSLSPQLKDKHVQRLRALRTRLQALSELRSRPSLRTGGGVNEEQDANRIKAAADGFRANLSEDDPTVRGTSANSIHCGLASDGGLSPEGGSGSNISGAVVRRRGLGIEGGGASRHSGMTALSNQQIEREDLPEMKSNFRTNLSEADPDPSVRSSYVDSIHSSLPSGNGASQKGGSGCKVGGAVIRRDALGIEGRRASRHSGMTVLSDQQVEREDLLEMKNILCANISKDDPSMRSSSMGLLHSGLPSIGGLSQEGGGGSIIGGAVIRRDALGIEGGGASGHSGMTAWSDKQVEREYLEDRQICDLPRTGPPDARIENAGGSLHKNLTV